MKARYLGHCAGREIKGHPDMGKIAYARYMGTRPAKYDKETGKLLPAEPWDVVHVRFESGKEMIFPPDQEVYVVW